MPSSLTSRRPSTAEPPAEHGFGAGTTSASSLDPQPTYKTALIPERDAADGPLTTDRLRRTGAGYLALAVAGLALACFAASPRLQAFGLGLILPGGGFLLYPTGGLASAVEHVGLTLATWFVFGLALFAWFGSGNILAPIAVWLGTAFAASSMSHHATWPAARLAVPGLAALMTAGGLLWRRRTLAAAIARRRRRNEYLAESRGLVTPCHAGTGLPVVEEMSAEDLASMRFLLDRALQPVDRFDGFDWIEQFQTSAVRYQVMGISYALSVAQAARLPALRGYLFQAQRNLIDKMMDHRIWRYWALENAWGNLRLDPDPMAPTTRDNVMYSGWYAAMIGMHASNTGDETYNQPGAIVLRHPSGREFLYDWPGVVEILANNFVRAPFTLFPCEPNWIYVFCNTFAAIGVSLHDRLRGTDYWERIAPDYRRSLEQEFMTVDGRVLVIRSERTGLTIPSPTSTAADAMAAFYGHALFPDLARRSWEIVRREFLRVDSGRARLDLRGFDRFDTGNYRRSNAGAQTAVMIAATEMGDTETHDAVRAAFLTEHPPVMDAGVLHHPGVSTQVHSVAFCARAGRTNALHDLVVDGLPAAWREGPLLEHVEYPEVLVARAVSDGAALDLTLFPGRTPGRHTIGLSQLRPGKRYRCDGTVQSEIEADADGRANVTVELVGRRAVRVRPAA